MANKGIWNIVEYPESYNLENALLFWRSAGASCMWTLHDKDLDKDGKPKKPHYHISLGWSKGFPTYKKLCDMIRASDPDGTPFIPKLDLCRADGNGDQQEDYQLHRDERSKKAGKYRYPDSDCHKDSDWNPADYERAEDRRKASSDNAKAEKAHDFAFAVQVAKENDIGEFADLVDFYTDNGLDVGSLVSVAYPVKAYLDSRRNLGKTTSAQVRHLSKLLDDANSQINKYQNGKDPVYQELREQVASYRSKLLKAEIAYEEQGKALTRAICQIQKLYENYTGEFVCYLDISTGLFREDK